MRTRSDALIEMDAMLGWNGFRFESYPLQQSILVEADNGKWYVIRTAIESNEMRYRFVGADSFTTFSAREIIAYLQQ